MSFPEADLDKHLLFIYIKKSRVIIYTKITFASTSLFCDFTFQKYSIWEQTRKSENKCIGRLIYHQKWNNDKQ